MMMAFTVLLYVRLVQLQAFSTWTSERGMDQQEFARQWMVAQAALNSSAAVAAFQLQVQVCSGSICNSREPLLHPSI